MNQENLKESHLRTALLHRVVSRLETALFDIREADNSLTSLLSVTIKNRDKPLTAETDSLLCRKTVDKMLTMYMQDAQISSSPTYSNGLLRSLYDSYCGPQMIDCLKLLIEERCEQFSVRTNCNYDVLRSHPAVEPDRPQSTFGLMEQMTHKHVYHVLKATRQAETKYQLTTLTKRANELQAQLECRLDKSGNFDRCSLNDYLRKRAVKIELKTLKQLLVKLQQEVSDRKAKFSELEKMEHDVFSFRSELSRCEQLIERLRLQNRTLSLNLPFTQQQAVKTKSEVLQHLTLAHQSLRNLVSSDPMQRLLPLLKRSDLLTDWKLQSHGCSISSLPHNTLCQNSFYNKCCVILGFPDQFQHPDVVLQRIASLALTNWVTSEEAERLRDALVVLEEESRTIALIQRRDVYMQSKARQRAKPYIDRINSAIEEIRSRLSNTQRFVGDWKDLALSLRT
ncbi:hypothetical protein CSKR_106218 [Clonorchis sinensis]|uniref:Uncharacterized protein n=1 Tax=Clonorchis sinensis TaxID=79923 RepID=A0A8T1M3P5_CLOSI|nr:hypothetical protein CSKR_106218 [Clonorchis sinensis]